MNQSNELNHLATALAKAQASLSAAAKDGKNPHYKSKYATLQSIWDSAREVLAPNGLSVAQTFQQTDGAKMDITTTLLHSSGQWIAGTLSMIPQQSTPQGIGSAITYGRRYALAAMLGIVADEDDDGNAASTPATKKLEAKEAYSPTGPMVSGETKQRLNALCLDANKATKLTHALESKGLISFSDLSEIDAQKLLKWATELK